LNFLDFIRFLPMVEMTDCAFCLFCKRLSLVNQTGKILLDYNADKDLITKIKAILESDSDTRLTDIHAWKLGSQKYAAIVSIEPLAK
jgi:Co/Zn/Cd efflux system component